VCLELPEKTNEDPTFISRITQQLTIVGFTVIQKQSNNRRSGRAHKHQEQKRCSTSRLQLRAHSLFFNAKGIVHCELIPPNTSVNSNLDCDVLRHLRENVQWKRPELWHNHNWLLHYDNTPAHMSLKTTVCDLITTWLLFPILPTLRT
jgi:hypothetical protein